MLQSILAVDSLAIQRSLTILEDRYRELREIGEKRFEAWEKEKGDLQEQLRAQAETLQQVQTARDEQTSMVQGLEGEMSVLKSDLAAVVEERASAQQRATELQEQLRAQGETLQQVQTERDEQTSMVKGLEGDASGAAPAGKYSAARYQHAYPCGQTRSPFDAPFAKADMQEALVPSRAERGAGDAREVPRRQCRAASG